MPDTHTRIIVSGEDRNTRRMFRRIRARVDRMKQSLLSMQNVLLAVGGTYVFARLYGHALQTADSFEKMKIKLDTLTKGRGDEWFRKLNQWAAEMPLNTEKAIDSFTKLKAMGLDPTIEDMTTIADTAAAMGSGAEGMQGIARALGQIQAKGQVSAEELMQLAERGISSYDILKNRLNLTADEMQNIGAQAIDTNKAIDALLAGMEERFGGASQRMMNTLEGALEQFKHEWKQWEYALVGGDKGSISVVEQAIGNIASEMEEARKQMDMRQLSADLASTTVSAFSLMADAAWGVVTAVNGIKSSMAALKGFGGFLGEQTAKGLGAVQDVQAGQKVSDLQQAITGEWEFQPGRKLTGMIMNKPDQMPENKEIRNLLQQLQKATEQDKFGEAYFAIRELQGAIKENEIGGSKDIAQMQLSQLRKQLESQVDTKGLQKAYQEYQKEQGKAFENATKAQEKTNEYFNNLDERAKELKNNIRDALVMSAEEARKKLSKIKPADQMMSDFMGYMTSPFPDLMYPEMAKQFQGGAQDDVRKLKDQTGGGGDTQKALSKMQSEMAEAVLSEQQYALYEMQQQFSQWKETLSGDQEAMQQLGQWRKLRFQQIMGEFGDGGGKMPLAPSAGVDSVEAYRRRARARTDKEMIGQTKEAKKQTKQLKTLNQRMQDITGILEENNIGVANFATP